MKRMAMITEDIFWVGGSDRRLNLFENIYPIPNGVSYNAYVVLDEQTVLLDTADRAVADEFMQNVEDALAGRVLDYVIVNHMEPDHSAALMRVCERYPGAKLVVNAKTAAMIGQFFGSGLNGRMRLVKEGDTLSTGRHCFHFVMAPMVHWPEVMVTYDACSKALFCADAFGTFGALNGILFADEVDFEHEWLDDARRYYTNIVGKYGAPVQTLLKKAAGLDIAYLCPLHGPIWRGNIDWFVDKYQKWSSYSPEEPDGVLVAYASIYGNTEKAAEYLARELRAAGVKKVALYDVSGTHPSYVLSEAFRYGKLALLSVTYNNGLFPAMETLLSEMKAHALPNRRVALVENGSWAPAAGKQLREAVEAMKGMQVVDPVVTIRSAMTAENMEQLKALAKALAE